MLYGICGVRSVTGQVFSEYFGYRSQSLHQQLHTYHRLSFGSVKMVQTVANVPSGLSLTPPKDTKKSEEFN
jgi:hypothetical protein